MSVTKALVIDTPWIDYILDGKKDWEMRSTRTAFRGWFGLIRKGSGLVCGVARLDDVGERLDDHAMLANVRHHRIPAETITSGKVGKHRVPWKIGAVHPLSKPVPYVHPYGAVIWVNLEPKVTAAIRRQLGADPAFDGRA